MCKPQFLPAQQVLPADVAHDTPVKRVVDAPSQPCKNSSDEGFRVFGGMWLTFMATSFVVAACALLRLHSLLLSRGEQHLLEDARFLSPIIMVSLYAGMAYQKITKHFMTKYSALFRRFDSAQRDGVAYFTVAALSCLFYIPVTTLLEVRLLNQPSDVFFHENLPMLRLIAVPLLIDKLSDLVFWFRWDKFTHHVGEAAVMLIGCAMPMEANFGFYGLLIGMECYLRPILYWISAVFLSKQNKQDKIQGADCFFLAKTSTAMAKRAQLFLVFNLVCSAVPYIHLFLYIQRFDESNFPVAWISFTFFSIVFFQGCDLSLYKALLRLTKKSYWKPYYMVEH